LLTLLGYGGGIYASLKNDNFHDFFTEYIPYGEEIVMNIEEREFRRKFPNASPRPNASKEPSARVTIPRSSGATARISDKDKVDLSKSGPHLSSKSEKPAGSDNKKDTSLNKTQDLPGKADDKKDAIVQIGEKSSANAKIVDEKPAPNKKGVEDKIDVKQTGKGEKEHLTEQKKEAAPPVEASTFASKKEAPSPAATRKDAPSKEPSSKDASSKDKLSKDAIALAPVDAHDPVIQDLVKIINTVISLTNETETAAKEKFNSVITSAKSELGTLSEKIKGLKTDGSQNSAEALKEQELEFTKVASGIVSRMDDELKAVEAKWRDEFERERATLAESYQTKLEKEINQSKEIADQKLRNELLEQAVEMKRQWIKELRDRVEKEREGRLGKLQELSSSVKDLEKLTTSWTDVLDANLSTQKLHVALEAVRTTISDPAQPRPFIKELAALKEVSNDNDVVKAAIASINPVAYQKGLVSPSQIVDRFRRVSNEVRKASLFPDDAGVAAHASSWVLSKLLFKKQGLATGEDVESILTRTETYLQEGELEKAAREMNQLQGWSKTLASDWLKEVRVVLEVQQAVEVSILFVLSSLSIPPPLPINKNKSAPFLSLRFLLNLFNATCMGEGDFFSSF